MPDSRRITEASRFVWLSTPFQLIAIVLVIWFAPSLFGGNRLGFRDVSHFYLPLYEYLADRVSQNGFSVPLWNPLILTGVPIVGDSTSAIFYPARLLFLLPITSELAMTLYVLLHIGLAGITTSYAGRWAGLSSRFAGLAAVIYAISAPVVQQYCNPPFLVGAAWLPLGLSGLIQCINIGSRRAIAVAAIGLAMPILGGDPQTTAHVLLIGAMVWLYKKLNVLHQPKQSDSEHHLAKVRTMPAILAAAIAFSATLIQIVPTLHWTTFSDRKSTAIAANHADQIYQYSVGPWNAWELAYPNVYGPTRPINGRWSRLLNDQERLWTTSIYCSSIALLALFGTIRRRSIHLWGVVAIVAFFLANGGYGMVWWIQLVGSWLGMSWLNGVEPAIGGPYWFLVTFLPTYASFRYPSKWLTIFCLGIAVTTGKFFETASNKDLQRFTLGCWFIVGSAVLILLVSTVWFKAMDGRDASLTPLCTADNYYGVLQLGTAQVAVRIACLHAIVIAACCLYQTRMSNREPVSRETMATRLTFIVAMDLLLAGFGWVTQVSSEREPLLNLDREQVAELVGCGIGDGYQIIRTVDSPQTLWFWTTSSSPQRAAEFEINEQRTLYGQWNLPQEVSIVNQTPTIVPEVHSSLWQAASEQISSKDPGAAVQWINLSRWLSAKYSLSYGRLAVEHHGGQPLTVTRPVWQTFPEPLPKIRWYNRAELLPTGEDSAAVWRKILPQIVVDPTSCPVWLEGELSPLLPVDRRIGDHETIKVISSQAESTRFELESSATGWLYLHVFQDGFWRADATEVDGERTLTNLVPLAANRIGQAIQLPPGHWRVRFQYTAPWLLPAAFGSLIAWLSIGFLILRARQTSQPTRIAADNK